MRVRIIAGIDREEWTTLGLGPSTRHEARPEGLVLVHEWKLHVEVSDDEGTWSSGSHEVTITYDPNDADPSIYAALFAYGERLADRVPKIAAERQRAQEARYPTFAWAEKAAWYDTTKRVPTKSGEQRSVEVLRDGRTEPGHDRG